MAKRQYPMAKSCQYNETNGHQRLCNIHQGFNPFIDQLAQKDAMSLINELCHLHKIKPEYELIDVQGPEHGKIFTVYVKLGVSEKHNGQGSSIKNAQQNAAFNALEKTRLKFPNFKQHNRRKFTSTNQNHTQQQKSKEKFDELNKLFIRNGIQPRYQSNQQSGSSSCFLQPSTTNFTTINNSLLQTSPYQNPIMINSSAPITQPYSTNQFHHHSQLSSNIPCYQPIPANITYFNPTYFSDPYTSKQYLIYELVNPGYIPVPAPSFISNIQSTTKSRMKLQSEINEKRLNDHAYEASVEFNGVQFCGNGKTLQEARQIAAQKALDHLKSNLFNENKSKNSMVITEDQKSNNNNNSVIDPISTLNHLVSRNRYKINFHLVDSYGPPHIPVFIYCCQLFDAQNNGKLLIETEGRDRSKKLAKKQAAQNMLIKIDVDHLKNIASHKTENVDTTDPRPSCSRSDEKLNINQNLDSVSNKSLTLLYDLARNMSLKSPTFNYSFLSSNHSIAKRFNQQQIIESTKGQIYRVECTLFFEQITPDKFMYCMKTVGFSLTQRMAKQISAFICLLRLGLEPPRFDQNDELFVESLRFSLEIATNNSNSKEFPNEENIRKFCNKEKNIEIFYNGDEESMEELCMKNFEINKKFILFMAKKFYYYSLKQQSTTKPPSIGVIREKIPFLLMNFEKNFPTSKFQHFNEQSIQQLLSTFDMEKYWNHLQFIAQLTTLGILDCSKLAIEFHCHTIRIDMNDSHCIAFISVRFNGSFNFDLIHKHYITYAFGHDDDDAREAASLRVLHKISTNAFKQMMTIDSIEENINEQQQSLQKLSNHSKPSLNQMKSKSIISKMYQICQDLFIRKPEFLSQHFNNDNLYSVQCLIHFRQDSNKLVGKLSIMAISASKRSSQTIIAYIFLCIANVSKLSLSQLVDVYSIPDFKKYLKISLASNATEIANLVMTFDSRQFEPAIYSDEQREDIDRNIEFIETLLKDVYSSYLKNQKRTDPSCLFQRVEDRLFEYHNHRKQMLDQSESFDRWSEHIREWINHQVTEKFNRKKYWHHLQLISLIASTLNSNLAMSIDPLIFEFKCRLLSIDIENDDDGDDSSINQKGTIALITIHCSSKEFVDHFPLLQKEFLSFAIDLDEDEAREIASYKALRYLSINLWKSIC